MTQGIVTYNQSNGKLQLTPDGAGGVFLRTITFTGTNPGQVEHFDFYDAQGMTIFGFRVQGGFHQANFQVASNGVPYSEALGYNTSGWNGYTPSGGFSSTFAVFAV